MHRKGLNMRFEWVLLAKLKVKQYRDLVMIDIMLRVMRKIINEEIRLKSKVTHVLVGEQLEEFYIGN